MNLRYTIEFMRIPTKSKNQKSICNVLWPQITGKQMKNKTKFKHWHARISQIESDGSSSSSTKTKYNHTCSRPHRKINLQRSLCSSIWPRTKHILYTINYVGTYLMVDFLSENRIHRFTATAATLLLLMLQRNVEKHTSTCTQQPPHPI